MYTEDGDALLGPRNLQLHAVIPGQYRGGGGVSLAGATTSIIFVAIKSFVATNMCLSQQKSLLSRQKYACHDKTFVASKLCLSRQSRVCHDKSILVTTSTCLSRQIFVVTNVLS